MIRWINSVNVLPVYFNSVSKGHIISSTHFVFLSVIKKIAVLVGCLRFYVFVFPKYLDFV